MSLIGLLLTLVTFPGVIVHEFAHKKACDYADVPVLETCYFRVGTPAGYVRHLEPERYRESFIISVAPFFVNSVVGFGLLVGYAILEAGMAGGEGTLGSASTLFLWLGISIGAHSFPSTGDANTLWNRSRAERKESPVVLLGVPIVVLIYLANLLSRFYLDFLYAGIILLAAVASVGFLLG